MTAKEAIRHSLQVSQKIVEMYTQDLNDADFTHKAVPGSNPIAWQLGHLIATEQRTLENLFNRKLGNLPANFAELHGPQAAHQEPAPQYPSRDEYLKLFAETRAALIEVLENLPEAELDKPIEGPMAKFSPNVGAMLNLAASHTLMHAGQFSVIRRSLGKPVLF